MRIRKYFTPIAAISIAGFVLWGCAQGMTDAEMAALPTVPAEGNFTVKQGGSVVIYGARGRSCGVVPSFSGVMTGAFRRSGSKEPKIGTLSDGGIAKRRSGSCKGEVPVRAIVYTAGNKSGSDEVVFYGSDRASITVTE